MKFADFIRQERINRNLKQYEMAQFLGVTESCYNKWERDKTEPSWGMWMKIAPKLDISTGDINIVFGEKPDSLEKLIVAVNRLSINEEDKAKVILEIISTYKK